MRQQMRTGIGFYLLILVIIAAAVYVSGTLDQGGQKTYNIVNFTQDLEDGDVTSVAILPNEEVPTGEVDVRKKDGSAQSFYVSDVTEVEKLIRSKDSKLADQYVMKDVQKPSWIITTLLPYLLGIIAIFFLFSFLSAQTAGQGGSNAKMMNFGKSRARLSTGGDITLKDVAGLEEEKEDLEEIVDFLKDPGKYTKVGARIPKGVLLEGAPGTGKTLLAKAIAGEAKVPFFSISGSDFVEMFVGVGASRVRDLFADAKKNSPCIVFIDEIDAVARRRGTGMGGGHDEREQTLNQLLVEMDGFGTNEGIIVLAATNRVDILDPAILRPGRFDRKVMVGRPDVKGREEILRVHVRNKPLSDDVDLHEIARTTAGFAGADLENLMNEAAICAAKQNRQFIKKEDVDKCFVKIGIGGEKKSRLVPEKERKITAYHESGHAILFHLLSEVGPVHLVSIIPNGRGAGGYTMPLPENDNVFMTKKHMLQDIMVSFGGRIAEELIFGDITTGASADIKQATQTAQAMVVKYGMSEKVGLINYEVNSEEEVFLGRDLGHARNYSEKVAAMIDKEVRRIMDECYQEAKLIIESHIDVLHRCAAALLEKERINRAEFEALFEVSPTETYPDGLDTTGLNL